MYVKQLSILLLSFSMIFAFQLSTSASPDEKRTQDDVEWVGLSTFPKTREGQLERMLVIELQRKILYALQQHQFVKSGKDALYWFDPFQISHMREAQHGHELDVIAVAHEVIHSEISTMSDNYQITFRHDYNQGFVATNVRKVH